MSFINEQTLQRFLTSEKTRLIIESGSGRIPVLSDRQLEAHATMTSGVIERFNAFVRIIERERSIAENRLTRNFTDLIEESSDEEIDEEGNILIPRSSIDSPSVPIDAGIQEITDRIFPPNPPTNTNEQNDAVRIVNGRRVVVPIESRELVDRIITGTSQLK